MRLVIIGGGPAGLSAALAALRERPLDEELQITLITNESFVGYCRCVLPVLFGKKVDIEEAIPRGLRRLGDTGIIFVTNSTATCLDLTQKHVVVNNRDIPFDTLILAIGTGVREKISLPGSGLPHVYRLWDFDSGKQVQAALRDARHVFVIGTGFVGTEVACFAVGNYSSVTVIDKTSLLRVPGWFIDAEINQQFEATLREKGAQLHFEVDMDSVRILPDQVQVGDRSFPADIVIDTLGGTKVSSLDLIKDTELELGTTGLVKVNERMETNVPGVYAAGTCTEYIDFLGDPTPAFGETVSLLEGRAAGVNAVGGQMTVMPLVAPGVLASDEFELGYVGLSSVKMAQDRGYSPVVAQMTCPTRAEYYPGSKDIVIRLIADKETGLLLGGSLLGKEGVKERTNLLEFALKQKAHITDLLNYETAFLPNLNSAPEPLVLVADLLRRKRQQTNNSTG